MRNHLLIFTFLAVLVIFLHLLLNSNYLNFGMHSDDWISLIRYKTFDDGFLSKLRSLWTELGPHTTSQIIYIGILESLFGLNYKVFNLINISFKILATLSIYPLMLVLFKRKLLAFLAVVFYSISYSTVGTFHDVIKGTEYQAIFFMNVFFLIYYYVAKKQIISFGWIFALILLFSLSILLAPPRLFPLTFLPLLIELFLWMNKKSYNLKLAAKKLFFLYFPFALLFIYRPAVITGLFIIPLIHLQKILEGYWFIVLSPLSGLGYMILWDSYWTTLIGSINLGSFGGYIISSLSRLIILFGLMYVLLGMIVSRERKRFIFLAVTLFSLLGVLIFFAATNHLKIPIEFRRNFDFNILYSVFVGLFIFVFSIACYIEWLKTGKNNRLLLALGLGSLFSLYFVFWNWLFADSFLTFSPSQEYLTVPAIGVSLMLAALLTVFYDKIEGISVNSGKSLAVLALILIFIPVYFINKTKTSGWLTSIIRQNNAAMQADLQQKIQEKIKKQGENMLVFFDWSDDKLNSELYSETIYSSFPSWSHYAAGEIREGCINGIFDRGVLKDAITEKSQLRGFAMNGVCLKESEKDFFTAEVFYTLENFYAFKVNNNIITDIREEVLRSIGID